ncbi:MAG: hypothetical protein AAF547_04400 [Actinomycetota bacterium]
MSDDPDGHSVDTLVREDGWDDLRPDAERAAREQEAWLARWEGNRTGTVPEAGIREPEPELSVRQPEPETETDRASRRFGLSVSIALGALIFGFFNWPQLDTWSDLGRPLLLIDTTPSGGDMGAHVWGPAYLRDNLLPQGRLSGWTPDWYAGFPAYHFYMVVPPLAIIAINNGLPWFLGIPLAISVLYGAYRFGHRIPLPKPVTWALAIVVAVLLVGVPYGVAFKLVSVAGLVCLPPAAWKMGRLAGSAEPIPTFLALASFVFIYDTNFTIYGGNIASTLAGEFSFAICLMLALLAIGMAARGMDNLLTRGPTAIVIALVALCHVLPVFFLIPALLLLVLMHPTVPRAWALAGTVAMVLIPIAFSEDTGLGVRVLAVAAVGVVIASAAVAESTIFERARWLVLTGPTAMLLSAFWLFPFVMRRDFFNDMGWEPIENIGPSLLTVPMKIALPVAAIGVLLSYAAKERLGMMFGGTAAIFATAVANVGAGPVWNARLLPFYYLSVYMCAAIGIAMVLRYAGAVLSDELRRPDLRVVVGGTAAAAVATLIAVAMPLRVMPFGQLSESGDGSYRWLFFTNTARSFVPGWVEWNYSGYEEKNAYAEYRNVVETMGTVGDDRGCGRAMWEHDASLDRYGTPMALMLLPHWTDGCIGSMEGLYFESSASTPFHFLNQSMLSDAPSRPQRNLPYQDFDIDRGIAQLQTTGVRYYMAQSDRAIEAARSHPDLTEVAEAQPFVVFEVGGSELVQGLSVPPVVVSGLSEEDIPDFDHTDRFQIGWVSQAVAHYNDPNAYMSLPAEDGPDDWPREVTLQTVTDAAVDPATVSDIEVTTNRISFAVDQIGTPVVVKASFFPNWSVDGADGPWRVGPNQMVVIPTEEDVTLSFGRSAVDLGGQLLTLLGVAAVFGLVGLDRGRWRLPALDLGDEVPGVDDPDSPPADAVTRADSGETDELATTVGSESATEADPDTGG